jgi:hypothetical protein
VDSDILIIDARKRYRQRLIIVTIFLVFITLAPFLILLAYGASLQKALLITMLFIGFPSMIVYVIFRRVLLYTSRISLKISREQLIMIDEETQQQLEIPRNEIISWDIDQIRNIYLYLDSKWKEEENRNHEMVLQALFVNPRVICLYQWMTGKHVEKIIRLLDENEQGI